MRIFQAAPLVEDDADAAKLTAKHFKALCQVLLSAPIRFVWISYKPTIKLQCLIRLLN